MDVIPTWFERIPNSLRAVGYLISDIYYNTRTGIGTGTGTGIGTDTSTGGGNRGS